MEVPIHQTHHTKAEVARLICARAPGQLSRPLDTYTAAAILATIWLETEGEPIGYNWGNLIALSESEPYWVPPWVRDPSHRLYGVPGLPDKFRAYDSAEAGMDAMLGLLERRYRAALDAARSGDFRAYSGELLAAGYCPDCSTTSHANTIESIAGAAVSLMLFENECGLSIPGREVGGAPPMLLPTRNASLLWPMAFVAVPVVTISYVRYARKPRVGVALGAALAANVALVTAATLLRRDAPRPTDGGSNAVL